ncbi:MAG: twin-arginine translocation signal domain-containing protein, partial [Acidobacteria bacterium]|nr:twin-arginine translocation signal domain-containing protein [Acidobacteriota bacterium]
MSEDKSENTLLVDRRDFLKLGGAATASFLAREALAPAAHALPPLPA